MVCTSSSRAFRFLFLAVFVLATIVSTINATQIMRRPDGYKNAPNKVVTDADPKVNVIHRRGAPSTKVSIGYFANWDIYGANFRVWF